MPTSQLRPLLALAASALAASALAAPAAAHVDVLGVAELEGDSVCLVTSAPELAPGVAIALVDPRPPQRIVPAEVGEALPGGCTFATGAGLPGVAFRLAVEGVTDSSPLIAVSAASRATAQGDGAVQAELDGAPPLETFRLCNASEGLYLTVWSGRPLTGRLRWQMYYYLGYDLDPDCAPEDSGDPGD